MKRIAQQKPGQVAFVQSGAALFNLLVLWANASRVVLRNHESSSRVDTDKPFERSLCVLEGEFDGPGLKSAAFSSCPPALRLHGLQLFPCLLVVPDGVIGAERNLLAARQQEFLADRKSTRLNSSHLVISYA